MSSTLRVQTTVLPGHRIEIGTPGLPEGSVVEVVVQPVASEEPRRILEFLDGLPAGPRSHSTWEEMEQHFQEERNAWDR